MTMCLIDYMQGQKIVLKYDLMFFLHDNHFLSENLSDCNGFC